MCGAAFAVRRAWFSPALRYRVEEGLVQGDSPFCGTKRFGMCYVDSRADGGGGSRMASVGTTLEIVDFAHVQVWQYDIRSAGNELAPNRTTAEGTIRGAAGGSASGWWPRRSVGVRDP